MPWSRCIADVVSPEDARQGIDCDDPPNVLARKLSSCFSERTGAYHSVFHINRQSKIQCEPNRRRQRFHEMDFAHSDDRIVKKDGPKCPIEPL
jgi:hypothetical protein